VRELENILERAVVLGGDVILPEHLSDHVLTTDSQPSAIPRETLIIEDETLTFPIDLDAILAGIEKQYIERALSLSQGAKKKAATLLGMNFRSFRYRLQKFGLAPDNSSQEQ
jgi:two-component system response regulator PilR (NtrC family)